MKAVVSERGQVTIPKKLRDRLGITPGEVLDFFEENGRLIATKRPATDPVDRVYGILRLGQPTDELMRDLRGPVDAVDW